MDVAHRLASSQWDTLATSMAAEDVAAVLVWSLRSHAAIQLSCQANRAQWNTEHSRWGTMDSGTLMIQTLSAEMATSTHNSQSQLEINKIKVQAHGHQ